MNDKSKSLKNLAVLFATLAIIGASWTVLEIGVTESFTVIKAPDEVNAATNATFDGSVGFLDRIMIVGVFATIIGPAGFGLYVAKKGDPESVRNFQKYMPWIIGVVGIVGFADIVTDTLMGDRAWDIASDSQNAYALFIATASATGILSFLGLDK
jgi:hypothetical protein